MARGRLSGWLGAAAVALVLALPDWAAAAGEKKGIFDPQFDLGLWTVIVFVIEVIGVLVRNAVLAVRLFANMFAGHTVLAVILGFIIMVKSSVLLWGVVTLSSVFGVVALSLLELFVAFLQAYIFTFLTALFMGMALYPQH